MLLVVGMPSQKCAAVEKFNGSRHVEVIFDV